MIHGTIMSGICGFKIEIGANSEDKRNVKLNIKSDCPNFKKIAEELQEVDAYELFQPLHLGTVYQSFSKNSPHCSCPGLSGILKTVEIAAGLALLQVVSMEFKSIQ